MSHNCRADKGQERDELFTPVLALELRKLEHSHKLTVADCCHLTEASLDAKESSWEPRNTGIHSGIQEYDEEYRNPVRNPVRNTGIQEYR